MSQIPQPSGVDLARIALRAAREAARKTGSRTAKSRLRAGATVRRDEREPMGLGTALGALITERAWELSAAGASLCERWAAIAPDLAGHVAAVAFDPDSGRLTVCPESSAWATKTRLEQTRVIEAANKAAGRTVVRALRILQPGAVPAPARVDIAPVVPAAAATDPVKTRETASAGYRRALAAHQEVARRRQADSLKAKAGERQTKASTDRQASCRNNHPDQDMPDRRLSEGAIHIRADR